MRKRHPALAALLSMGLGSVLSGAEPGNIVRLQYAPSAVAPEEQPPANPQPPTSNGTGPLEGAAPAPFGLPYGPPPIQSPLGALPPPPNAMLRPPFVAPPRPPLTIRDFSWTYIDTPPPRIVKIHDIITVVVDEKSEVTEQSLYNRQKIGIFKLMMKEFMRIDSQGNLAPAAENSPQIDTQLQGTLNARGQLQQREGVKYRIAATVVDVLPNGTIILEAHKSIRTNLDVWDYSLTGKIRPQDILSNNTVLSENIADLDIKKGERGRVKDSTKRGWGLFLYDKLGPF